MVRERCALFEGWPCQLCFNVTHLRHFQTTLEHSILMIHYQLGIRGTICMNLRNQSYTNHVQALLNHFYVLILKPLICQSCFTFRSIYVFSFHIQECFCLS